MLNDLKAIKKMFEKYFEFSEKIFDQVADKTQDRIPVVHKAAKNETLRLVVPVVLLLLLGTDNALLAKLPLVSKLRSIPVVAKLGKVSKFIK